MVIDINGKKISGEIVYEIINSISSKIEFNDLDYGLIEKELSNILKKDNSLINYLISDKVNKRSEKYKKIIKLVRAVIRQKYGMFIIDVNKRNNLLKKLEDISDLEIRNKILSLHLSSKERIVLYSFLFEDIFKITGLPKSILDLGCGFNPIGFPFNIYDIKYYALDISKKDCDFLNDYFKKIKVDAISKTLDLTKLLVDETILQKYPADICFLFKLLESIEIKGHKLAELLLDKIQAKWIVVSFPKKKLSGMKMNVVERKWFEKICERKNISYIKLNYENEFFYILRK